MFVFKVFIIRDDFYWELLSCFYYCMGVMIFKICNELIIMYYYKWGKIMYLYWDGVVLFNNVC